ncbi:MAG: hypothetical protein HOK35_17565 [Cytophagia bacterium]|nr:hypothetical protein [Bacteroidota bacterium]MBT5530966.1 hypothetical protein [Cytophagia bacterium]
MEKNLVLMNEYFYYPGLRPIGYELLNYLFFPHKIQTAYVKTKEVETNNNPKLRFLVFLSNV